MTHRFHRTALLAGASILMLSATVPALGQNINTMPSWNGSTFISSWGVPNTATYGQTITATVNQRLKSFSFQLALSSGTAPSYRAHVYAWDSVNRRITGSALFTSATLTAPTTASASTYQAVTINTDSIALAGGQQYVLMFTTSGLGTHPANSSYRYGSVTDNTTYAGGQFVFNNNGTDFTTLSSTTWSFIAQDLAFTADFNSLLVPLLGGGTAGQSRIASAIDRAVTNGVTTPASFSPLYDLSGATLGAALDQLSGQVGIQSGQAVSANFLPFLQLMLDQDGAGSLSMAQYAPGKSYADADAPEKAQLAPGEVRVWGVSFGGGAEYDGNAAASISGLQSSGWRFATGVQRDFGSGLMLGASLSGGQDTYQVSNGKGRTSDLTFGVQARQSLLGSGYIAGAMGFGRTDVTTTRTVTISGTDVLQGKFDADSFGGRIEGGYAFDLGDRYRLTPFAAFTGQNYARPAHTETAIGGGNAFALSYQGDNIMLGQVEIAARLGRSFAWGSGSLGAEITLGWTQARNDAAAGIATFQSLPSSSFQVLGVGRHQDGALLGLKLEGEEAGGLFYGLRFDSILAGDSTTATGTANLGWRF